MPRQKNDWTTRIYRNTSEDPELLKKVLYLSVKVIGTQLLIENTFFMSPDRDGLPPPPPKPCFWVAIRTTRKSSCLQSKDCAFFLRYLKTTMSIGAVPGIKPATFRSVKKIGVLS